MHVASGAELFMERHKKHVTQKQPRRENQRTVFSVLFHNMGGRLLAVEVSCRAAITANNKQQTEAGSASVLEA